MNEQYSNQGFNDASRNGMSVTMGFMCGAILGAGLALLLAPASGVETRRRLGESARRLKEEGRHRIDQARETIDHLKEDARSAIETGRETFRGTKSQPTSVGFQEPSTRPV